MTLIFILSALLIELIFPERLSRIGDRFYLLITQQLQVDFQQLGLPKLVWLQWWVPVALWFFGVWFVTGLLSNITHLIYFIFTLFVLAVTMHLSRFSQVMTSVYLYLNQGDFAKAKQTLSQWVGLSDSTESDAIDSESDLLNLAVKKGCERLLNQFFSVLFWFVLFGIEMVVFHYVVYQTVQAEKERFTSLSELKAYENFETVWHANIWQAVLCARFVLFVLNWVPARLFALCLASKMNALEASQAWQKTSQFKWSNVARIESFIHGGLQKQKIQNKYIDAVHLFSNWVFTAVLIWLAVIAVFSFLGFVS